MNESEHQLRFSLSLPVSEVSVRVVAFEGQEIISGSSGYQLEIALPLNQDDPDPDHQSWLFSEAHFMIIETRTQQESHFHGLVTAVTLLDRSRRHHLYRISLEPVLMLLSHRRSYRIFHNQSVASILVEILDQLPLLRGNYQIDLRGESPPREYCVQYGESDLDFICRLMAGAGMIYYFAHKPEGSRLVITDSGDACLRDGLTIPYVADGRPIQAGESVIGSFHYREALSSQPNIFRGYDYVSPEREVLIDIPGSTGNQLSLPAEHYLGNTTGDGSYHGAAENRVNTGRLNTNHGSGQSNCPLISAGRVATINGHPSEGMNGDWLFWEVIHHGRQLQALEEEVSSQSLEYNNRFRCQRAEDAIAAPSVPPASTIQGPQTALVAGPEPGRVYTDELGRIKLRFHWGSDQSDGARSSRWVRVGQISAGAGWGAGFLPRVGQEVIVEYEHGDPERPIVTGVVYNGRNRPEHFLPEQHGRSIIRSSFLRQKDKFSEIVFEDGADNPALVLYSDGDIRSHSKGDQLLQANGRWQQYIQADSLIQVDGNHHLTVKGAWRQSLHGDCHSEISGDRISRCDGEVSEECGESYNLNADEGIVLSAKKTLTIRVGNTFLRLLPDGLYLSGAVVKINSGGKADSVSVTTPESPQSPEQAPREHSQPDDLVSLLKSTVEARSPAASSLAQASRDHTPFIERCKS